jgi:hypothetical protein
MFAQLVFPRAVNPDGRCLQWQWFSDHEVRAGKPLGHGTDHSDLFCDGIDQSDSLRLRGMRWVLHHYNRVSESLRRPQRTPSRVGAVIDG